MAIGDGGYLRVYGKSVDRRAGFNADGSRASDWGESGMAGFRADWLLSSGNRLSLNGEVFRDRNADTYEAVTPLTPSYTAPFASTTTVSGGHLQGRYESLRDDGSEIVFQSYLTQRLLESQHVMREERKTLDLDFQYRFAPWGSHDLMLGANYRNSTDSILTSTSYLTFARQHRDFQLFGVFINDEVTLLPERFRVTLGARLEHNNSSGVDLQPTARFLWTPNPEQTVWGALSHAARTPSRAEEDLSFPVLVFPPSPQSYGLPVVITHGATGDTKKSEKMDAAELGYRQRLGHGVSLDATAYVHRYRDDLTVIPGTTTQEFDFATRQPYLKTPLNSINGGQARIHGFELAVSAQINPAWRLKPAYAWIRGTAEGIGNPFSNAMAQSEMSKMPRHQLSLRSQHDLCRGHQIDLWLKYKSATRFEATATPVDIPASANLDIRYAWKPSRAMELSVVGQNLLHRQTLQYLPDQLPSSPVEIGRGFYLRAEFRF
jgi:iron complex outermembrane receptor protein